MDSSNSRFDPRPLPTIFGVLLIPLFIYLGLWQLDRAHEKRTTAASIEARKNMPSLVVDGTAKAYDQVEFRSVSASGQFDFDKQVVIENRKHRGKTGFHVITPLRLEGTDRYLLVNRGWIQTLGELERNGQPGDDTPVLVSGRASLPKAPALVLDSEGPAPGVNHWPFFTLPMYANWSGLSILPFLLLQSPQDSHGFIRRWPASKVNDAMHIGYAVQWFAFALILVVIWARLSWSKPVQTRPAR